MRYPTLTPPETRRDYITAFGGYDRRPGAPENAFRDMKNLSSDLYPAVSPRAKRGVRAKSAAVTDACALLAGERLAYAAAGQLFVDDAPVMALAPGGEKTLVAMGAYVLVFPDKLYYNTADPADCGPMEHEFTLSGEATLTLCREDGAAYPAAPARQAAAPADPENLDLWLDSSASPHVLKQYAAASGMWETAATACVRIEAPGIGAGFRAGDAVLLEGVPEAAGDLAACNGAHVILRLAEENAVVITGLIDGEFMVTGGLRLSRRLPEADLVFECGNRLWGCRYGLNAAGGFVNEIFCSKLGDFRSFYCFEGLSTDSFTASVGADGPFTGAAAYRGSPLFFKRDCLFTVYGAYPAAYRIRQSTGFRGVKRGSERSLAIVNERLFYHAEEGVCAYDGAAAVPVSAALGGTRFSGAVAGAFGGKYYVSLCDPAGERSLFVYDDDRGLWHREDGARAAAFAASGGALWFIEDGRIVRAAGAEDGVLPDPAPVEWMLETADLGTDTPDKKTVTRVDLRMILPPGSAARVYLGYEGEPCRAHAATLTGGGPAAFSLPVTPRRCDRFRLRIEGKGEFRLLGMGKTEEVGAA